MALELLQQCKNFFGIIVLQFVGHLLGGSMVGLMATSSKSTYAASCTPRFATGGADPLSLWQVTADPVPPQETLKHSKACLAQSLD